MKREHNFILAMLLAGLLAMTGVQAVLAQNGDDPPPLQEEDPPAEEPAEDPQQEEEDEEDREIKPRLRPSTDEEERAFKRQATRNDPFLNPLLPLNYDRVDNSGYNPRDFLRREGFSDLARYIVQTPQGGVLGFYSIHCSLRDEALSGPLMDVVKFYEYDPEKRIEMHVQLATMRPVLTLITPVGETRSQQALDLGLEEVLRAEYLFDRVTVRETVGGVTGMERERMLPFSFDIHQLDSIVRNLDYESGDWPLVAVVYDPKLRLQMPISIDQPRRSNMNSAELENYGCWELNMQVGNEHWQWWVERLAPHRIIRFSDAERTYTLMSYTQGE